ncbi:unnamed protein product [Spirodela intermedia]|uniref:Uncharacterized protein n=1 Tax=Spirodela intermedia TaxID=51605 RepID=A0A7I8LL72_SPIIN|nr:unnamed protein product [Spirodela intermedia]
MAMRRNLVGALLLWVAFLLLLLLHGWSHLHRSGSELSSSIAAHRKMLTIRPDQLRRALHHHHHHHHHRPLRHRQSDSSDGHEIDPRYGVEKRLVPTGPNPLHH